MYKEISKKLQKQGHISFNESFLLAKSTSQFINNKNNSHLGRIILIIVLDNWKGIPMETHDIWIDLIESVGFYPYLEKNAIQLNSIGELLRKEFHKSKYINKFFHEEQLEVLDLINDNKNVIVSAPTSFGKSLLIEEIVASKYYRNLVIIQPTLALLDETRKNLIKYRDDYKIIVRTSQEPATDRGNLFLLTAERVMEYKSFPSIDFLILDEFYKLSTKRDDERSDTLNNAFYYMLEKHKCKFYLLGPNIDGISKGFIDKYDAIFYHTDYSLVANRTKKCYSEFIGQFGEKGDKKKFKELKLFELLLTLQTEQTIIYCSSPKKARDLASGFMEFLRIHDVKESDFKLPLAEWIEKYVIKTWCVLEFLKFKIGVHDGALLKHISSTIIQYFNEQKLNYLFCTTTIIEGVNTSAKNVVYFSPTKGSDTKIDYFDYCNIRGRSGRMMVHYIGNIYEFNPKPVKEQIIIDIPFYDQNPICDEVLINIDKKDVIDTSSEQYKQLEIYPHDMKSLFQENVINIKGQNNIIQILESNLLQIYDLINWTYYPKYEQLQYCLELAWNYLQKDEKSSKPMTCRRLVKVTFDYANHANINHLIVNIYNYRRDESRTDIEYKRKIMDDAIREAFQILKHWFQYKIPKWLLVMNNLQNYVCVKHKLKPGSYIHYASAIENDFVRENMAILTEFGIPKSAIDKLTIYISAELNEDLVLEAIKREKLFNIDTLLDYEKQKILENL